MHKPRQGLNSASLHGSDSAAAWTAAACGDLWNAGPLDRWIVRCLPILRRRAQRRLPAGAIDLHDADDLVQMALLRALAGGSRFGPGNNGTSLAYLRRILDNLIRDERRRAGRTPARVAMHEGMSAPGPSPLDRAILSEGRAFYRQALSTIPQAQRNALILRFRDGLSFREISMALTCPSADAARMLVARGLVGCRSFSYGPGRGSGR